MIITQRLQFLYINQDFSHTLKVEVLEFRGLS